MDSPPDGWPTSRWRLTAPESYVLLHGPAVDGAEPLRLALLELVAGGALRLVRVEEQGPLGRPRPVSLLAPGPLAAPPSAAPLTSVWLLYGGTPLRTYRNGTVGVPLAAVTRAARRRYRTLGRYVAREVLPPLLDRRLYAEERAVRLWLWPVRRITLTPAGARLRADLAGRLALAERRLAGWVERDPARALAFLDTCGAAVLLMTACFPALRRLAEQSSPGTPGDVPGPDERPAGRLLRRLFASDGSAVSAVADGLER